MKFAAGIFAGRMGDPSMYSRAVSFVVGEEGTSVPTVSSVRCPLSPRGMGFQPVSGARDLRIVQCIRKT
jgi:hypothetical protein